MSQFGEISRPLTAIVRNTAGGASPRVGITESLDAPGLEPLPPVSSDVNSTAQAIVALGLAGDLSDALAQMNYRSQAILDREQAEREEADRQAAQFSRGQAAEDAEARVPIFLQEIEEGKILVPDGQELDEFFAGFVDARTEGQTEAYRTEYRRRVVPDLVRAQTDKNLKTIEQAREESAIEAIRPVFGSSDPEEFARAEAALTGEALKIPLAEARARVGLSAMQAAALRGDRAAFAAAETYLGGLDPIQQAKFAITLEERENQNQQAKRTEANDRIAALYNARDRGEPITFDFINREIERIKPQIGENHAERLFAEAKSREAAEESAVLKEVVRAERDEILADAINSGVESTLNARTGVAGNAAIPRVKATLSDGSTYTVSNEEMRRGVIEGAVETIRKRYPDPKEAFARTIEYLDLNGFTLPEWQESLAIGQRAGLSNFVTQEQGRKPGAPVEVPQTTIAAIQLWKSLPQSTRAAHASPETAVFYDLVEAAMDGPAAGDVNRALSMVVSAQQGVLAGGGSLPTIDADTIRKHADWTTETANGANLQARIRRTAQLYVAASGMEPKEAVKRASEELKDRTIEVGPARLPLSPDFYSGVPKNLPAISERVVDAYLKANPDEPDRDPDNFSLLPIPGTSLFAVHSSAGPAQAPVDSFEKSPAALWDFSELLVLESVISANPDAPIVRYSPEEAERFMQRSSSNAAAGLARARETVRTRRAASRARYSESAKARAKIAELESKMAYEKDAKKAQQMIDEINRLKESI